MGKDNNQMDDILKKASKEATTKTYKGADKGKDEITTKATKKGTVGRSKVAEDDKKKARQVFYSNNEFIKIEDIAEEMGMDTKAFMQMCINQKVKSLTKDSEES